MKIPAVALLLLACLVLLSPHGRAQEIKKPIITYDNNGGVAYGGCKLELYASGEYHILVYDDAGSRYPSKGKYERVNDLMTLIDAKGARTLYHIVISKNEEYLLGVQDFQSYSKKKDIHAFYGLMRRID